MQQQRVGERQRRTYAPIIHTCIKGVNGCSTTTKGCYSAYTDTPRGLKGALPLLNAVRHHIQTSPEGHRVLCHYLRLPSPIYRHNKRVKGCSTATKGCSPYYTDTPRHLHGVLYQRLLCIIRRHTKRGKGYSSTAKGKWAFISPVQLRFQQLHQFE